MNNENKELNFSTSKNEEINADIKKMYEKQIAEDKELGKYVKKVLEFMDSFCDFQQDNINNILQNIKELINEIKI